MSFIAKLKSGLSKSSGKVGGGIAGIFTRKKLDATSLEELEELLIESDMGVKAATQLACALAEQRFEKDVEEKIVREFLAAEITKILEPVAKPLALESHQQSPVVMMVVGVNGNGKTTTIGKLASQFKAQGKQVMLVAADTFRAAAVEQLQQWGKRSDIPVVTGAPESDPASVAYSGLERAKNEGMDVLLIDTAGRLHNKANLMAELQKITKVLKKLDADAPHHIILVLDATTGQNAVSQMEAFKEIVQVSGLIVTKLDGTAKGGVVVALAKQFGVAIHAVGVGEGINDLDGFQPVDFARNLVGL